MDQFRRCSTVLGLSENTVMRKSIGYHWLLLQETPIPLKLFLTGTKYVALYPVTAESPRGTCVRPSGPPSPEPPAVWSNGTMEATVVRASVIAIVKESLEV